MFHRLRKTPWLQTLLCFSVLFFIGAVGGFLWCGYTAETLQGGTEEDHQKQEHEEDSRTIETMVQSGLIAGTFGFAVYGVSFPLLKRKQA